MQKLRGGPYCSQKRVLSHSNFVPCRGQKRSFVSLRLQLHTSRRNDCRKKRDEILAIRKRDNIKTLVVEHDYSVYPFTMRVGSPKTCYPAYGGHDAQELGDWEDCLQKAKANPEGVAILMVLTAEGTCSKLWITTRSPEYLTEAFLSEDELNEADSKELVKVKQS